MNKIKEKFIFLIRDLQNYAERSWYGPLIGLLAALDNLLLIVPTDGITISSSMLNPKRWLYFAVVVSIGSTAGALVLSYLVNTFGLPTLLEFYPQIDKTQTWEMVARFFQAYGLFCIFVVSITPVMQQPVVLIASLAATPYSTLAIVIFVGRLIKYLIFAYLGLHAPKLLSKVWGVKGELAEVGRTIK